MTTESRTEAALRPPRHATTSLRKTQRRAFTVDEYYRMSEAGILHADERVELLDGLIVKMAAIGSRHAACVRRLDRWFERRLGDRAVVSVQSPVRLSAASEPEPDVALLRPRDDLYESAHPTPSDVLLIIELSDTTRALDRGLKLRLYAAAGIVEAWIVDLNRRRAEMNRAPGPRGYAKTVTLDRGATLTPLASSELSLSVREIFVSPAPEPGSH
jgi:Uma2 family endonuclease